MLLYIRERGSTSASQLTYKPYESRSWNNFNTIGFRKVSHHDAKKFVLHEVILTSAA